MKRIIDVPIEALPDRYSADWQRWFEREYKNLNIPFLRVNPTPLSNEIRNGSFLDVSGTNYYKAMQIAEICKLIYTNDISDDDVFLFHDLWHFGIEALAYMRDGMNKKFKITGCLHAGSYDPYDFLSKKGMGFWGEDAENSWFKIVDKIFVATEFHRQLILSKRKCDPRKIVVTHWPFYYEQQPCEKENIIVFPHRLDSEKNDHLFTELEMRFRMSKTEANCSWKFLRTKLVCRTKQEYYNIIERAKIAISFADQETFGIAMMECLFADCLILVPNRLSYVNLYPPIFRYDSFDELYERMLMFMSEEYYNEESDDFLPFNYLLDAKLDTKIKMQKLGGKAIERMIEEALSC